MRLRTTWRPWRWFVGDSELRYGEFGEWICSSSIIFGVWGSSIDADDWSFLSTYLVTEKIQQEIRKEKKRKEKKRVCWMKSEPANLIEAMIVSSENIQKAWKMHFMSNESANIWSRQVTENPKNLADHIPIADPRCTSVTTKCRSFVSHIILTTEVDAMSLFTQGYTNVRQGLVFIKGKGADIILKYFSKTCSL